ncbi:MAG: DUF1800 family protein [Gemmataceae bacterium]
MSATDPMTSPDPAWAWAAYRPDADRPWDARRAAHLFRRAGFGASWRQLQQAVRDGPDRTVDALLRPDATDFNRTLDDYEAGAIDRDTGGLDGLREWWLRRMLQTPHPLLERMTLFWHDHFAVNNTRVRSGWLMHRHIALLRSHALGKLEPLLTAAVRDPAVLLGGQAEVNRKAVPNEAFARVLLERYTVGPGVASAGDVRAAARALSGLAVLRNDLRVLPHERDLSSKTVLGQTGTWDDADLARILARHPATARHLTRRLYRWLVSEADEPADELLAPLAEAFARDGDVGRLVETVLRSNLFFADRSIRRRVKSPVEFVVGLARGLEAVVPTRRLGPDLAALGQALGAPPILRGWAGGTAWVNPATLTGRHNLAVALLADPTFGGKLDPAAAAARYGHTTPVAAAGWLLDLFLQGDVPADAARAVRASPTPRAALLAVVDCPEFHLT